MLLAWLALHLSIGLAGTWLARRYALHRNLLDQPGERRSHAAATPRGGGIAIVASMLVAMVVVGWHVPDLAIALALAAGGLVLVAGIGWIDDHRPLSPWLRLGVHAVAGCLLALAVLLSGGGGVAATVALIAALVLVNVWNFMDGIDGLATTQALLAAAGYAAYAGGGPAWWLGLALAAASAGFLPFNLPRARIFLGDVGSGALGYGLAMLLLASWLEPTVAGPPWLLLLPLTAFVLDASLTLARRMLRRERWWEAHVQHAYQGWARRIGAHVPVVVAYGAWTMAMVVSMWVGRSFNASVTLVMIMAAWLAGGAAWWLLQRRETRFQR